MQINPIKMVANFHTQPPSDRVGHLCHCHGDNGVFLSHPMSLRASGSVEQKEVAPRVERGSSEA